MTTAAEFLLHIRRVIRLYESLNRQVCDTWHITQIETDIIAFLKNNPEKDTARDIACAARTWPPSCAAPSTTP